MSEVTFTIDSKTFSANIFDNATAQYLLDKLPLSITMHDLNNNEKYHKFNERFPTNTLEVEHINKGDIMLYQDSYLVIFYKSFDATYRYTPIGTITNPDSLEDINHKSDIDITIK
ncbi:MULTISPECIES: cyclophilin-like fold protein [Mammaliicoccus]|uniref:cyclophilin-like fold protein n=1 Tax=Mammaliicoccus TaxID=2803850 RepID=UPI001EFBFA73|nr:MULTISPECIES: cyclophilin-like fold protein [Mammaliicoccus]MEB7781175.1 cyclophilin-like fold protein [Mammaliicoccus fleurettii]